MVWIEYIPFLYLGQLPLMGCCLVVSFQETIGFGCGYDGGIPMMRLLGM